MDTIRGAIENTVSISQFNKGLAGRVFEEVKRCGAKVVMKNNMAECVLMSPAEYVRLMDEVNDARLTAEAATRMAHFDPAALLSQQQVDEALGLRRRIMPTHPRWSLNELGNQVFARSVRGLSGVGWKPADIGTQSD